MEFTDTYLGTRKNTFIFFTLSKGGLFITFVLDDTFITANEGV